MNERPSPYPLRPSSELREKLEAAARSNGRTLHSEIIARLEASFSDSPSLSEQASRRAEIRLLVIEEIENYLHSQKGSPK